MTKRLDPRGPSKAGSAVTQQGMGLEDLPRHWVPDRNLAEARKGARSRKTPRTMQRLTLAALVCLIASFIATGLMSPTPGAASAMVPTFQWYSKLCTGFGGCNSVGMGNAGYENEYLVSHWGMYAGHNCTNYAAYRLIRNGVDASYLNGQGMGWQWGSVAASHGVAVDKSPRVGDIAWFSADSGVGSAGHVAYVESVSAGQVTVSEDNWGGDFDWRKYNIADVTGFIHFGGGGAVTNGSYVSYEGNVYRIAGGAPVYVSSWAHMGGDPGTTRSLSASEFAALRTYPADGTYIVGVAPGAADNGTVYRVAGGAPVYVSSWAHMGGDPGTTVAVDLAAIHNGGAGGVWNHLRYYPTSGTVLTASGRSYRVEDGVPRLLAESKSGVAVDPAAIANAGRPGVWSHLKAVPTAPPSQDAGSGGPTEAPGVAAPGRVVGVKVKRLGRVRVAVRWSPSPRATGYQFRVVKPRPSTTSWKSVSPTRIVLSVKRGHRYVVKLRGRGPGGTGPVTTRRFTVGR